MPLIQEGPSFSTTAELHHKCDLNQSWLWNMSYEGHMALHLGCKTEKE